MQNESSGSKNIVRSLGLIFGDIGTSPIYTLSIVFLMTKPTPLNIMGILSLIIWTLIIIVTIEYAWLAMSLSKKGEGGTIVLKEILTPLLKSKKQISVVTLLAFIGISLFIGDGVITPAISILSAVEGLLLMPGFEKTSQIILIGLASLISICLFLIQKKGTGKVAGVFGPIMLVWFLSLTISGAISIMANPQILKAISPYYAIKFFMDNGVAGIFALSQVIICATGGEALYADMGHLGRKPILKAWSMVFFALAINYLGQGAFLLSNSNNSKSILFGLIFSQSPIVYMPFLILSIAATIIASQAMISGMFSIVYQGIRTHIMPMFKVDNTSPEISSQIYIPSVNWFLMFAVLFVIFEFRESSHLAAAYGLAVNGVMVLTAILMTWIFLLTKRKLMGFVAFFVLCIVLVFLYSNIFKIQHGGYWSIIISTIPFSMIMIYTLGQKKLYKSLKSMDWEIFLKNYENISSIIGHIAGTALFFIRDIKKIPPYIVNTMFSNNIIYEDNILVSIVKRDDPFGTVGFFKENPLPGLRIFEIQSGYLEILDVESILKEAGIEEKVIFYGLEDIVTKNILWKIFSVIKKLTPAFVQFYKLPSYKLHGIITRVEI